MSHRQLKCPMCGEELDNLQCPGDDCSFNEDYSLQRNNVTIEEVVQQLAASGAYINTNTETLIIPGQTVDSRYPLNGDKAGQLASFIRSTYGMTQRTMQAETAQAMLSRVRHEVSDIPKVNKVGDYPLMHRRDGKLVYLGRRVFQGYLYNGMDLRPQEHNGVFDEWIDTFRWATQEDRAILRAWILSLFAQPDLTPAQFPALLLSTYSGSSVGKTTTAYMIAAIFGRIMSKYWSSSTIRELDRELLTGDHRFFCADNLVPQRRESCVENGKLAEFITKDTVESKLLFSSGGTVRIPKPTLDIITANFPILSLDLLQRVVVVGLTNRSISGDGDWIGVWKKRRREILEEGMHIVQTNSAQAKELNDCTCGYPDFRFPKWYAVAAEVMGRAFNPYPSDGCIGCPLDVIFGPVDIDRVSIASFMEKLDALPGHTAKIFRQQIGELTADKLCGIITRWSKQFTVEESEDGRWIISKNS